MVKDAFVVYEAVLRDRRQALLGWKNYQVTADCAGWGQLENDSVDHVAAPDRDLEVYDEHDRLTKIPASMVLVQINNDVVSTMSEGISYAWKERFGSKRKPSKLWKTEAAILDHFKARPRTGFGWTQRKRLAEKKLEPIRIKWAKAAATKRELSTKPMIPAAPPQVPYWLVRDPYCQFSFIVVFNRNGKHEELNISFTSYRKRRKSQPFRILDAILKKISVLEDRSGTEADDHCWISADELRKVLVIAPTASVSRYVTELNKLMADKTQTRTDDGVPKLIYGRRKGRSKQKGYYYIGDTKVLEFADYIRLKNDTIGKK